MPPLKIRIAGKPLLASLLKFRWDNDTIIAAKAWLDKMDAIYDPIAKTIWTPDDILDAHRIRKHIVEILHGLEHA
jgi:hypothetical protein